MQCSIIISLLKASLQLYWVDRQTESPAISISNSTLFPHPFYASFFSQKLNNHTLSPIHTPLGPSYSRINNGGKVMKVYKRMRANGITPNAYTYGVLIQALSKDPNFLGGAKTENVRQGIAAKFRNIFSCDRRFCSGREV
ncbi:hypothetical protein M0R45_028690 [Rubus argutus]|uniref:Pentatricopeptide repeat-containing protein n=1 Tax=Rubus argutus TaxID=59490 RepID=A0AAW1W9H2_RUBAR